MTGAFRSPILYGAYQRVLGDVLHYRVQHLKERISGRALDVRRVAAYGHVEHRPHRLTPLLTTSVPLQNLSITAKERRSQC